MCVTNDRNCLSTSAHRIATVAKTARKMIPLHASSAEVEIMYQDDDLLAVNKPGGTTTTPAHRHTGDSLLNRLIGESASWPVCILATSWKIKLRLQFGCFQVDLVTNLCQSTDWTWKPQALSCLQKTNGRRVSYKNNSGRDARSILLYICGLALYSAQVHLHREHACVAQLK